MTDWINNKIIRRIVCIVLSFIFVSIGIWCFFNVSQYQGYSTQLSIAGSLASILGIIIAIIQIYHTKTIAEVTREAAEKSEVAVNKGIQKVQHYFTLADVSQIKHLPNEIQDAIQNKNWGRAYEKMRNLKDELVEFKNNPELGQFQDYKEDISTKIQELEIRIKAFGKGISNKKEPYAYNRAMDLMEEIRTLLCNVSTQFKFDNCNGR